MSVNYKKLGDIVELIDERNKDGKVQNLIGVSIDKCFIKSVANTIGTDLTKYQVIRKNDFACSLMQVSRDGKIPIACLKDYDEAIMSPAYYIFRIKNTNEVLPDYLAMWFMRTEFDREASYIAVGGVRGSMPWEDFCDMKLPVPDLREQEKIVNTYNAITKRIQLKQKINENLEKQIRITYKNFKETNSSKKYKLVELCSKIGSGATPRGGKTSYTKHGISFIRSMNVFDYNFEYEELAHINEDQAKELDNVTLQENDILFNITGVSVARCCLLPKGLLPSRVNQHVMIIRPKNSKLSLFLMSALCDSDNKQLLLGISQSGSTREAINKQEMENFTIAIPSDEIIEKFNKLCKPMCNEREIICKEISKLQELKQLVISRISGM